MNLITAKKNGWLISFFFLIVVAFCFVFYNWLNTIGEYQLKIKSLCWKALPRNSDFSLGPIRGKIPKDYFVYSHFDSAIIIIKIKNKSERREIDNFKGPNLEYYVYGLWIYFDSKCVGESGRANYYKILGDLMKLGSISSSQTDTLNLNGILFEGIGDFINFKTGIIIQRWGISKSELIEKFQLGFFSD